MPPSGAASVQPIFDDAPVAEISGSNTLLETGGDAAVGAAKAGADGGIAPSRADSGSGGGGNASVERNAANGMGGTPTYSRSIVSSGLVGGLVGQASRFSLYILPPRGVQSPDHVREEQSAMLEAVLHADAEEEPDVAAGERLPGPFRVFSGSPERPMVCLVPMASLAIAKRAVADAFDRLDWRRRGVVNFHSLTEDLGLDEDTAEELFNMLEYGVSKEVSKRAITQMAQAVLRDWSSLSRTIDNYSSVTDALRIAVHSMWFLVVAVSALLIFNVSLLEVIVPVSTVIVGLSFALGEPIRQLVLSILLLVVHRPFQIGDRVKINGGEAQYVHRISLMGTWFRTFHAELKYIPNHILASSEVENHRRSKDAVVEIPFPVGYRTTPEQIEQLSTAITHYVRRHSAVWRPEVVELYVYSASPATGRMELVYWLQHWLSWQDGLTIWGDIGKLNVFVMSTMTRLGIDFVAPAQPVAVAPPSTLAPSLRLTAGSTQWLDTPVLQNPSRAPTSGSLIPPVHRLRPQAPFQHRDPRRPQDAEAAGSDDPGSLVPMPYDKGLTNEDASRDAKVQQFDAKKFGDEFVDIRGGPLASTWTWRQSYSTRAGMELRKRHRDAKRHGTGGSVN